MLPPTIGIGAQLPLEIADVEPGVHLSILRDVSVRRAQEQDLARSEERFVEAIRESTPEWAAAETGIDADTITSTYYPGTARSVLAAAPIRVLLQADEGRDTVVYAASGLKVENTLVPLTM